MTMRTSSRQVTFRRPFLLDSVGEMHPAGTFTVNTDEELVEALSFPVWRRIETIIVLARAGTVEHHRIDPEELNEALLRDGAQPGEAAAVETPNNRYGQARAAMRAYRMRNKQY